jgi:transposase
VTPEQVVSITDLALNRTSNSQIRAMFIIVRTQLIEERQAHAQELAQLRSIITSHEQDKEKAKQQEINKTVNQPSSKKPEWDKDSSKKKADKKKKKKRRARKGAGNKPKPTADVTNQNPLVNCPHCTTDLSGQTAIETPHRIVEDIAPPPEKTVVSLEVQQSKWCPTCQEVVRSQSPRALPKSDIGIHATVLIAYMWVVSAISMPGIVMFLKTFFRMPISASGVSKMMIRLGNILAPVHEEILGDVKAGVMIFADETGWRVHGELWWLWIFANARSAYYWPDRQRGSPVVEKILGTVFSGVLITDAWCAYQKIVCSKQTCMAHIFRKVRKFRDAYPQYWTIVMFYKRLRRIIADGERLRSQRSDIGEESFARRLSRLKARLEELLAWKNANEVLAVVIEKVARQQQYILTFISHAGVPTHNNYAEYIIKRGILKRKVSGGSMSSAGVMAYAQIQSVAMSCHLRGLSFKDYLFNCLIHYIRTGKPLLLAQYENQQLSKEKMPA